MDRHTKLLIYIFDIGDKKYIRIAIRRRWVSFPNISIVLSSLNFIFIKIFIFFFLTILSGGKFNDATIFRIVWNFFHFFCSVFIANEND